METWLNGITNNVKAHPAIGATSTAEKCRIGN
jgi:hypothetical protein